MILYSNTLDIDDKCRYNSDRSRYAFTALSEVELSDLTQVLGGEKTLGRHVQTQIDLISLGRRGVPKASLLYLATYMGFSVSRLVDLLPVTERTIQRHAPKDLLSTVVSEHILQIAEVVTRGVDVFSDKENFLVWFDQPNTALGGRSPKILASSRFGNGLVLDELTRIEYGVVS